MDVVGSEIGQKMRSAIKAKLTELGCYVDDELPDYVMVMVANKRTRAQMEEDLQLFLGENNLLFVNWLHQVLRKLQEVTVTAAPVIKKPTEVQEVSKDRSSSKDRKTKEKRDKSKEKQKKSDSSKKSKKKLKEKQRKKGEKKSHKKKKSKEKDTEIKRPNIPPLLMNMEKDAEPSITDVFAGQILKNHGITLDTLKEDPKLPDIKPTITEIKRPILPIIDPATISSEPNVVEDLPTAEEASSSQNNEDVLAVKEPIETESEQIKEINEIESKIQGLKQKLAEQLDTMSDDEDFLNIRTEAEELINDFAEETLQETSATNIEKSVDKESPLLQETPPSPSLPTEAPKPASPPPNPPAPPAPEEMEVLPQIELNLPKRPIRDRLGARSETKKTETKKSTERKKSIERRQSPERFTPEKEPDFWGKAGKSVKSRLGDTVEVSKRSDDEPKAEASSSKRLTSRVSLLESREARAGPASVVRVRPRPRPATNAPASNLLLRAVADANRSLRNIPSKPGVEPQMVKRALVLPMRRGAEPSKIVIQVQSERVPSSASDCEIDIDTESLADLESDNDIRITKENRPSSSHNTEYIPAPLTKKFLNTNYVPSRRNDSGADVDETLVVETINNHKTSTEKEKGPTFVVTLDGLDPNVFLAKKLQTEGILDDEPEMKEPKPIDKPKPSSPKKPKERETTPKKDAAKIASHTVPPQQKKRLSDTSEDSDTQVIIQAPTPNVDAEKRKSTEDLVEDSPPPVKKRRASPIVFDVDRKDRTRVRERTESAGSDSHVTIATTVTSHKYDTLPSLSQAERKLLPCRAFPMCRFGVACAFAHPPCKFAAACTRRGCVYSHPPATVAKAAVTPSIASQVVPVGNFKSILASSLPNMCKFYPDCANSACHYYHPKPCRYGKSCANRLHCNFYHHDQGNKWRVT